MRTAKVFKCELRNILRSRLILTWAMLIFALTICFIRISGDFGKAVLSLFSVLSAIGPLIALLFSGIYWYYADRFTQLVLTMPIKRSEIFWARWLALIIALSVSQCGGLIAAFGCFGRLDRDLLLACALSSFLVVTFVSLGLLIAIGVTDRMKGIGLLLATWLYFLIVHDGLLLLILMLTKDYPMQLASAVAAALNPIGLVRVTLLLKFDAPLLLSQTDAIIRRMVTSWSAYGFGTLIAIIWAMLPTLLAKNWFKRSDF